MELKNGNKMDTKTFSFILIHMENMVFLCGKGTEGKIKMGVTLGKMEITLRAKCSCCGKVEGYDLNEKEFEDIIAYKEGRLNGYLQELFPNVPAWIRSGAIDVKRTNGFCICPECSGF